MDQQVKDRHDVSWSIAITPYEYGVILDELGVDMYDVVALPEIVKKDDDTDEKRKQREAAATQKRLAVMAVLESHRIVEVLWLTCRDQANDRDIDKKQFLKSWDGATLDAAYFAILESLKFFFTNESQRYMMEKMIVFCRAAVNRMTERSKAAMVNLDPQLMGRQFVDSAIALRESLDSTSSDQTETDGDTHTEN